MQTTEVEGNPGPVGSPCSEVLSFAAGHDTVPHVLWIQAIKVHKLHILSTMFYEYSAPSDLPRSVDQNFEIINN